MPVEAPTAVEAKRITDEWIAKYVDVPPAPNPEKAEVTNRPMYWVEGKIDIEWPHLSSLIKQGIPVRAMLRDGKFTFKVIRYGGCDYAVFSC